MQYKYYFSALLIAAGVLFFGASSASAQSVAPYSYGQGYQSYYPFYTVTPTFYYPQADLVQNQVPYVNGYDTYGNMTYDTNSYGTSSYPYAQNSAWEQQEYSQPVQQQPGSANTYYYGNQYTTNNYNYYNSYNQRPQPQPLYAPSYSSGSTLRGYSTY